MPATDPREACVLVLAPVGRDARLIAGALRRHGLAALVCRELAHVCREMATCCGAVLLAEEALLETNLPCLVEALGKQLPWSDLPLLILTGKGAPSRASIHRFQVLEPAANVTQMERPVRIRTLVSAARAALRGRQRQYDVRDYLAERQRLKKELRHRAEQLAETDRRKDEFLATLAHELRNPLAPVRSALQILRSGGDDRPGLEHAQAVLERQVRQLVRLVDDLLDVSRISRGTVELKKERIALASVVATALETSRPLIEAARHELTVALPQEPVELEADPTRLAQVVSNLLNNSAKYTDPGGRIWLTAERKGDRVAVRVRDTGVGIAPEMLPRVFDMFMQEDRSRERTQGGLGVGLTLVQTLVTMHGGTVEVRSAGRGQGSEFTIRLPIASERRDADGDGQVRQHVPLPVATRRVLVVDDNVDAADTLAVLLRRLGHDVRTAHDGPSALEAARVSMPEVAILDIGLPGMDGHELARHLRAEPEGGRVLLIALTGWGQAEERRRSHDAGFDYHLTKPVDLEDMQRLLGKVQ